MLSNDIMISKDELVYIKQIINNLLLTKRVYNEMFQDSSACSPIDIHGHGSTYETHAVSPSEPLSLTDLGKVSNSSEL